MIPPNKLRRLRQHLEEGKPIDGARVLELVDHIEKWMPVAKLAIEMKYMRADHIDLLVAIERAERE